jgi:hypothetical protein
MRVDKARITQLNSSNGVFNIGDINFQQEVNSSITMHHGVNDIFIRGSLFTFSLSNTNIQSFEIKEFVFYHDKIYSYNFADIQLPTTYAAGTILMINVIFIFETNYFDVFILQPIIRFVPEEDDTDSFFVPLIATMHEVPMTYHDIKEYVANA